ncbi:MAG: PssE/Cps14G family polysaccharide biosynthesis glycosyltransferase [Candidatus Odinarchaeota archaeon]
MKLFITVGTSSFDPLFRRVDDILKERTDFEAIGQIGTGLYKPVRFTKIFRFTNNIDKYYAWADLIISHGGAGTIYDILRFNKKAIVIPNRMVVEEHQVELVTVLHKLGYIMMGDLDKLSEQIAAASTYDFKPYISKPNKIQYILDKYIRGIIG